MPQFPPVSLFPHWGEGAGSRRAAGPLGFPRPQDAAEWGRDGCWERDNKGKTFLMGRKRHMAGKETMAEKCLFPQV